MTYKHTLHDLAQAYARVLGRRVDAVYNLIPIINSPSAPPARVTRSKHVNPPQRQKTWEA